MTANQSMPATMPVRTAWWRKTDEILSATISLILRYSENECSAYNASFIEAYIELHVSGTFAEIAGVKIRYKKASE